MLQCLRERVTLVGCSLAVATGLAEVAAIIYYLRSYGEYLRTHPGPGLSATPAREPDLAKSMGDAVHALLDDDTGTLIGVAVTSISSLLCNIFLFYGVWRRKLMCFMPWMLLHAALFGETIIALFIWAILAASTWSFHPFFPPVIGLAVSAVALLIVGLLVKEVFTVLFWGEGSFPASQEERYYYTNGGSDYSRDHLEMHSYAHSSPRMSLVTAMDKDRVHL